MICYDHNGTEFPSETQMLKYYGINYSGYHYRMEKLGWSQKDALTKPHTDKQSTAIKCVDHEGNIFPSKAAMCDYWRIPRTLYFRRIRDGWSEQKALTTPVKYTNGQKHMIVGPNGKSYITIDEMCKDYNISKKQYMMNIRNNCSIQEALTTITTNDIVKDHLGNTYSSINEMCKNYGISKTTLRSRIELGWSLKDVLENPQKINNNRPEKDHLGNTYDSLKDMLDTYGVSEMTFNHRKAIGWSLEKCLSNENQHNQSCEDHLGNKFNTIQEMCKYWNLSTSTYYGRQFKLNWPLDKTLTTFQKSKYNMFGNNIKILKQLENAYYVVNVDNKELVMSATEIINYYHKHKGTNNVTKN